ncbi:hypothetical protein P152DRAFT_148701 [Eremomyces bilateralis CBS 781.70]|uniref:CHY-type domain-containing protein n=1 Tax=Eremomyces bilateralis CBS 781.70 TaxID=1392243 RepID=A0A6G1FV51_9PEZI|nr:uncharacterized protein P152DRAFT_148701 [Eremomyces bilateralis CBS 781.70]KAF1809775.1 hypothetical protein P152DRAFT_148701 [Eremomyces bilateralis CBS 781.70]
MPFGGFRFAFVFPGETKGEANTISVLLVPYSFPRCYSHSFVHAVEGHLLSTPCSTSSNIQDYVPAIDELSVIPPRPQRPQPHPPRSTRSSRDATSNLVLDGGGPSPGLSKATAAPPPPRQGGKNSSMPPEQTRSPHRGPGTDKAIASPGRVRRCRFYRTPGGCRKGPSCPYLHETLPQPSTGGNVKGGPSSTAATSAAGQTSSEDTASSFPARKKTSAVQPRNVVTRPVPNLQVTEPREFEIAQLQRRFKIQDDAVQEAADGTTLMFSIQPSDPDFPYDLEALECSLNVPGTYRSKNAAVTTSHPNLRVLNKELGRGFQINLEKGFDALVAGSPKLTLLQLMNTFDRSLESLLGAKKAETFKLVVNRVRNDGPSYSAPGIYSPELPISEQAAGISDVGEVVVLAPEPTFSPEQLKHASRRRTQELRQLEARMGRLPLFSKFSDGVTFIVPIEPSRRNALPESLKSVKKITLIVPHLYPLQPCRLELSDLADPNAASLANSFIERVTQNPDLSIMNHLNYLAQNIHSMAIPTVEEQQPDESRKPQPISEGDWIPISVEPPEGNTEQAIPIQDREHIITIPRPPEWSVLRDEQSDSDYSDSYDSESDTPDPDNNDQGTSSTLRERGIMISFPGLELHGIELLELTSLSLVIRCERCKDSIDVIKLRDSSMDTSAAKSERCKKCGSSIDLSWRKDFLHSNSVRAGYLDIEGGSPVELLPSNFVPTCSECSTAFLAPGLISVRGQSSMANCRNCHQHMSFRIPEVKMLRTSGLAVRVSRGPVARRAKEKLGIVTGEELPRRGRCKHYGKSYRWFRFSCCSKVFPCDKCHDEVSDHPNEHANRMICGFCSREQNYRTEDCVVCHGNLVGSKRGTGFWEGGRQVLPFSLSFNLESWIPP